MHAIAKTTTIVAWTALPASSQAVVGGAPRVRGQLWQIQDTKTGFIWTAVLNQADMSDGQAVGERGGGGGGGGGGTPVVQQRRMRAVVGAQGGGNARQLGGGPVHLAQVCQAGLAPLQLASQPLRVRHACVANPARPPLLSLQTQPADGACTWGGGGGGRFTWDFLQVIRYCAFHVDKQLCFPASPIFGLFA